MEMPHVIIYLSSHVQKCVQLQGVKLFSQSSLIAFPNLQQPFIRRADKQP